MSTKTAKAKPAKSSFRYAPEDVEPRDCGADEAFADAYTKRNKDALNASIEEAHAAFERGDYFTLDQAIADVKAQRQRRQTRKA